MPLALWPRFGGHGSLFHLSFVRTKYKAIVWGLLQPIATIPWPEQDPSKPGYPPIRNLSSGTGNTGIELRVCLSRQLMYVLSVILLLATIL